MPNNRPVDVAGWVDLYREKVEPFRLLPGYNLWATHEHGFLMWKIEGDIFWLNQCCGDAFYWVPVIDKFARDNGCVKMRAPTIYVSPGYCRLFGGKIVGEYQDGGNTYHVFEREVPQGA